MKTSIFENRLPDLEEACHQADLRLTHQRLEVFREVVEADDHPSAEAVYSRVRTRMPTISLDTVYRTLGTLTDLGLINRLPILEDHARYDGNLTPHHHLVCDKCRQVFDFRWSTFDGMDYPDQTKEWGRVVKSELILRGVCQNCLTG